MPDNYIIKVNGEIVPVYPKNGTDFKLDEVQEYCQDSVEVVYDNGKECMIASENAIEKGFELNLKASILAAHNSKYHAFILGDVIICKSEAFK